jgi:hypothetical protein
MFTKMPLSTSHYPFNHTVHMQSHYSIFLLLPLQKRAAMCNILAETQRAC